MKRENAGSWNSGLEKEQILETYSAQLQKSWNSTKRLKKIKKNPRQRWRPGGPHPAHEGGGRAPLLGCAPYLVGPLVALRRPSSPIWSLSMRKSIKQPFGTGLRRHEAEPWRNQSRSPAELFCRGHFPPGGGNHHHRHHQRSSHRERAISINIFTRTISSQTLVHLLYPILVSKSGIGTYGLLVVLITACSWC